MVHSTSVAKVPIFHIIPTWHISCLVRIPRLVFFKTWHGPMSLQSAETAIVLTGRALASGVHPFSAIPASCACYRPMSSTFAVRTYILIGRTLISGVSWTFAKVTIRPWSTIKISLLGKITLTIFTTIIAISRRVILILSVHSFGYQI